MKIKFIFYIIFCHSILFCDAMHSVLNQNALYLSYSYYFDNVDYLNQNSESVDAKAYFNQYEIGYVLNGIYDFNINFTDNKSPVNDFHYIYQDTYGSIAFTYHLKDLEKSPLDFKVGFNYTKSSNNLYESNSLLFGMYKEYNSGNYPVVPFLNISNLSYSYDSGNDSKSLLECGMSIKLAVDEGDNSVLKDVIWISPSINTDNFIQYYLGLTFGIYHPIN